MDDEIVVPTEEVSDLEFRQAIGVENVCDACGYEAKSLQGLRGHWTRSHSDLPRPARLERSNDVPPTDRKPGRGPGRKKPSLETGLTQWFVMIGVGVSMFDHDGFCGVQVGRNAQNMARAWDHLGQENRHVRKALEGLLTASAVGEVVTASFVCFAPILAHHGALPKAFEAMPRMMRAPDFPPPDMGGPNHGS